VFVVIVAARIFPTPLHPSAFPLLHPAPSSFLAFLLLFCAHCHMTKATRHHYLLSFYMALLLLLLLLFVCICRVLPTIAHKSATQVVASPRYFFQWSKSKKKIFVGNFKFQQTVYVFFTQFIFF